MTDLAELVDSLDWDTDPQTMDAADVVESHANAARLLGMFEALNMAIEDTESQQPRTSPSRLRMAWNAVRGREPQSGADTSELSQLADLNRDVRENVDHHLDTLGDQLADSLDSANADHELMFQ